LVSARRVVAFAAVCSQLACILPEFQPAGEAGEGGAAAVGATAGDGSGGNASVSASSTGAGSVTSGGAGGPVACAPGSVDLPKDDFEEDSLDGVLWFFYGDVVTNAVDPAGFVSVTPPSDAAAWGGVYSVNAYQFKDCQISIEVTQALSSDSNAMSFFDVQLDWDLMRIDFDLMQGHLLMALVDGVQTVVADVPYDPAVHRFWRLREEAGVTHFDTSDGASWTTHGSVTTPSWVDAGLYVDFGAGSWDAGPAPGSAHFDNVNIPP
jgi:hypothetical protein